MRAQVTLDFDPSMLRKAEAPVLCANKCALAEGSHLNAREAGA